MGTITPWLDAKTILVNGMAAQNLTNPVALPNEQFDEPTDPSVIWIAMNDLDADTTRMELGDNLWLEEGMISITVNVMKRQGIDDALSLLWKIAKLYRHLGPRAVVYTSQSTGLLGPANENDGGNWYAVGLTLQYRFQDIASAT